MSRMSRVVQSSTPLRLVDKTRHVAKSTEVTPVGSPMKRLSIVAFGIDDSSEYLVGSVRHA